jgi:hypothetical protein
MSRLAIARTRSRACGTDETLEILITKSLPVRSSTENAYLPILLCILYDSTGRELSHKAKRFDTPQLLWDPQDLPAF